MTVLLSNRLCHLADEVRAAEATIHRSTEQSRVAFLTAGALLVEAKDICRHGEWLTFLKRAGVSRQRAAEMMKVARAGLQMPELRTLGGIRAALKYPESDLRSFAEKSRELDVLKAEAVNLRAERDALWQELAGDSPEGLEWLEQMKSGEAEVERIKAETAEIVQATEMLHVEARQMADELARIEAKSVSLVELLREKQMMVDMLRDNARLRARVAELETKDNEG